MHEVIKVHSVAAGLVVKEEGKDNDLLARLGNDERIPFSLPELHDMIGDSAQFAGRAAAQTEEYLRGVVEPRLARYQNLLTSAHADIQV
jgi:adenylosuccinate lyase